MLKGLSIVKEAVTIFDGEIEWEGPNPSEMQIGEWRIGGGYLWYRRNKLVIEQVEIHDAKRYPRKYPQSSALIQLLYRKQGIMRKTPQKRS